jgi:hypothetical protein
MVVLIVVEGFWAQETKIENAIVTMDKAVLMIFCFFVQVNFMQFIVTGTAGLASQMTFNGFLVIINSILALKVLKKQKSEALRGFAWYLMSV